MKFLPLSKMVVPKYSATLGLPHEKSIALNGNHITIAKYATKRETNFVTVATHLRRLVANIAKQLTHTEAEQKM